MSVLVIWDTQGSGKLWTTLAGVAGVTGVPENNGKGRGCPYTILLKNLNDTKRNQHDDITECFIIKDCSISKHFMSESN